MICFDREVPEAARAVRNAPGIARKPGVLVARRALRRATRRGAKAAEVEAIARRVAAPVLVGAVDVDALALSGHRVAAARAKEPPAFPHVVSGARGKLLFAPRRRSAVKEEKHQSAPMPYPCDTAMVRGMIPMG